MERKTMQCSRTEEQLDGYLDGWLDDDQAAGIALHVQSCPACAHALEQRQALREDLERLAVPEPDPDLFARMLANAEAAQARRPQRAGTILTGLAAAVLAALALTVVLVRDPVAAPETGLPSIHLATDTVTPVKLAFSSEKPLTDARLTLRLPVGVELVGYEGRTDLSWSTDLEAGANVLRLPLVGHTAASDLLIARLDHPTGTRTFRLRVTVDHSGATDDERTETDE